MGVPVYALGARGNVRVAASRYCRTLPLPPGPEPWPERVMSFLTAPEARPLHGAVLLASNDAGVEILARNRDRLLPLYRLDACNPPAQLAMLDKLATYRAAVAAGVPTPRFREVGGEGGLEEIRAGLRYPLIVKPRDSGAFQRAFPGGRKHVRAASFDEALRGVRLLAGAGLDSMLVEVVPGPDDRLCSYYTHLDEDARPAFHFTKRVIRRFPPGEGEATYHVVDDVPGVGELSLRLFRHVGLQGLANAEFKLDERDGGLKLIEVNARFTAANAIVAESGLDLARWVYRRAAGLPPEPPGPLRTGLRMWEPLRDFRAYRALAAAGELTFRDWLRSLRTLRPFWFRRDDPLPTLAHAAEEARRWIRRRRPGRRPEPGRASAPGGAAELDPA
jgi:predicted ATP-grasp superfamily ATP-dependent carboligase